MTNLTVKDLERMFSNPVYCLKDCEGWHIEGEPMVDEETWVRSGVNLIKEIGAEKFLRHLLKNLKGQYYAIDEESN